MNKQRRKSINPLIAQLEDIQSQIESLRNEEQEYLDNMPEGLAAGETGEAAQAAIDALETAQSATEDTLTSIAEALDALWEACNG